MVKANNGYVSEEEEIEAESQNGEEEEYEIEAILDAKQGAFEGGQLGYLVKWKNYSEENNSWVSEEDASNAQDLIQAYWARAEKKNKKPGPRKSEPKTSATSTVSAKKRATPEDTESISAPPKKRGRPPKAKPVSESEEEEPAPVKTASVKKGRKPAKPRDSDAMDEDVDESSYADMKKWATAASWDQLVDHIDTVERTEDGKLYVYFQLNKKHGEKMCREETSICREKMPKMLFDFYENNLRWRPFEG